MTSRRGLTLIEVLMALVITALVMLLASEGVRALLDHARRGSDRATDVHRLFSAWRELGMQVRLDGSGVAIAGDRGEVRLRSWCDAAGGWSEPCSVTLSVASLPPGACRVVLAAPSGKETIESAAPCGIRYLAEARDGGLWQAEWHDPVHLPEAIEIVAGGDTLFARVGKRG